MRYVLPLAAVTLALSSTAIAEDAVRKPMMISEAKLPEGFPGPGPVGEVITKTYPAHRLARVRSGGPGNDGSFMKLFRHIERNEIAMTAPVEMEMALADGGPTLILVGGELRRRSQSIVGPLTQPLLQQLHFDTAFMGTMGVSLDEGVTTTDPNEAFTKQAVMGQSTQKVLLADSSKLGEVAFARAGKLADFGTLITDKQAPARFVVAARKIGLNVVLA